MVVFKKYKERSMYPINPYVYKLWAPLKPISVWEMDDESGTTCKDSCGTHNGLYSSYTLNNNGIINKSVLTTASNNQITFDNSADFTPNREMSWNFWIKFNAIPVSGWFLKKRTGADKGEFQMAIFNNVFAVTIGDGITNFTNTIRQQIHVSSLLLNTTDWFMFTITYNGGYSGSSIKIYKNTVLQSSTPSQSGTFSGCANSTTPMEVTYQPGTYYLNCFRDQMAIFDKELTQNDIDFLYNNGTGQPFR
jgi:hypothetical protein